MNVEAQGGIWLSPWRWLVWAALIIFQIPHCTGAEQDSGTKRQQCVPAEMLQGAQEMALEPEAEAKKDMSGLHKQ